jgi:hypothetical protein
MMMVMATHAATVLYWPAKFLSELRVCSATCSPTARLAAVAAASLTSERAGSTVPLSKTLFCEYSQLQTLWTFSERTE